MSRRLADDGRPTPSWMRIALVLAAAYNVAWGGAVVVFPNLLFDLLEIASPTYPEIWQCVGMIVGVYGVGYAIAAADPIRHWPIVLVGLLGKVLGPIGFIDAVLRGVFPWAMGWTIVTNDLVWWIPFSLILLEAIRVNRAGGAHERTQNKRGGGAERVSDLRDADACRAV